MAEKAYKTYSERLSEVIEDSKRTQAQIAADAGTTQQVVSGIIQRKSLGSTFTAQFARACGVDANWLATGRGERRPRAGTDLPENALELARMWTKLPDFKRRGYMQAILTDAAVLEVFPELENAMRAAMLATDPEYHKLTEGFQHSRAQIARQMKLSL